MGVMQNHVKSWLCIIDLKNNEQYVQLALKEGI